VPELILDIHRSRIPIDHPDRAVTRAKLEYPTVDVRFAYLDAIDKLVPMPSPEWDVIGAGTSESFADKALEGICTDRAYVLRVRGPDTYNGYAANLDTTRTTQDFSVDKVVNKVVTILGAESVDLLSNSSHLCKLSASGSTLKGYRANMATPKVTVTDTTFASGRCAVVAGWGFRVPFVLAYSLRSPSSESPRALAVLEVEADGSGSTDDPFRPLMSENLVDVSELQVPDFLKLEKRKYDILKAKGFTDEEMKTLLGYVPQHQVNLDSVSWGAFEFSDKSPTNIIVITSDNPYRQGAIDRQAESARKKGLRALRPPRDYDEAVSQYNELKRDFKHWLAGKDNYAYQTLGLEVFDLFQNVDFYYGELIEHKAHYDQLKMVPEQEIRRRLEELEEKLRRVGVLAEERDRHLSKLREVVRRGW